MTRLLAGISGAYNVGAWLQSVLSNIGRAGSDVQEAKERNLAQKNQQAQQQLKLQEFQSQLQELQQRLQTGKAPQLTGSYTGADGKRYDAMRDPLSGKITYQVSEAPPEQKGVFKPLLTEKGDYVLYNDVTKETKPLEVNGQQVKGFPKGKNGPLIIDTKPAGVIRNGQPVVPTDPDWTDADAVKLASYLKTYGEAEEQKNARIKLASTSRVEAYMKTRMYGAMDAGTGALVYVTPSQIVQSPGKYAPAGAAVSAKTRTGIFQDMDVAQGFLNEAIAKLPDKAFDPGARAQIAGALRSSDPSSAWHEFLSSSIATTLDDSQVEYVTALINMQESALALRSIAGMGQGSDKMRDAITKMLPGGGTPSKSYAIRQMKLFKAEVDALRTTVPMIGEPGQGGGVTAPQPGTGTPPPDGKVHFTEGSKSWDIPQSMVNDFKKEHPNAR
jgi:hypothetical protein